MVLILTSYMKKKERIGQASVKEMVSKSHNLLTRILSDRKEVITSCYCIAPFHASYTVQPSKRAKLFIILEFEPILAHKIKNTVPAILS